MQYGITYMYENDSSGITGMPSRWYCHQLIWSEDSVIHLFHTYNASPLLAPYLT
jgi:hypothetical protein